MQRDITYDIGKGIAISLVVLGHAERGLREAGVAPSVEWLLVLDYVIYAFHMPFFFFVSGLFHKVPAGEPFKDYLFKALKNLGYTYILWSLLQGGIMIIMSRFGLTNTDLSLVRLASILWMPISPFWFLYSLFFSQIILRLTHRLSIYIVATIAFALFISLTLTNISVLKDIAYGLFYFSIGVIVNGHNFRKLTFTFNTLIAAIFAFGLCVTAFYFSGLNVRFSIPAAFAGILALTTGSSLLAKGHSAIAKALSLCGQLSLGIYVMHITAIGFSRAVATKVLHLSDWVAIMTFVTAFAILATMLAQYLAIRLGVNGILGLPASAFPKPVARTDKSVK